MYNLKISEVVASSVVSSVISLGLQYAIGWIFPFFAAADPVPCVITGAICGAFGLVVGAGASERRSSAAMGDLKERNAAEVADLKERNAAEVGRLKESIAEKNLEIFRLKTALSAQDAMASIAAAAGLGEDKLREIVRQESPQVSLATEADIDAMFE